MLAEAGDSIKRFLDSGVLEMGDRLGPLLWQFAPTKKFDAADFGKFLELLPGKARKQTLRHVVEVRHDSFRTPESVALLRSFAMPVVFTDHETYPSIADVTGDFVYARLQRGEDSIPTAYPPKQLGAWPAACETGQREASPRTCRASTRRTRSTPLRATSLPMSSTRARYARQPRRSC